MEEVVPFYLERMICHNQCLGAYYDLLTRYYKEVTIWKTQYVHVLSSYEEMVAFMSSTGLRPYLEELEEEHERSRFICLLMEELRKVYPIQENGKILYPFERMEWIAQ